MPIYIRELKTKKHLQTKGIEKAKQSKKNHGREEINIDLFKFEKVVSDFENNLIDANSAAKKIGISRSTFFRRLRKS